MASWYERRRKTKKEGLVDATRIFPHDHRHSAFWCEKCWAPYRKPTADGVLPNGKVAATMITHEFACSAEYLALEDKSPDALRAHMEAQETPLCCRLGEEIMGRIFAEAVKFGRKV